MEFTKDEIALIKTALYELVQDFEHTFGRNAKFDRIEEYKKLISKLQNWSV